jgi:D-alanine-D-alanine ligase
VGVAFGGRSVEHDVSIITGLQAVAALSERHAPVPVYIARSGRWYTGEALRDLAVYQQGKQGGGDPDAEEVTFDLHSGRLLPVPRHGVHVPGGGSLLRTPWRGTPRGGGQAGGRRAGGRGGRGDQSIDLDAVVLATHGTQGEDGCLQGALELAQLPYAGPPVGAAAAAMDKVLTKAVLAQAGLPALAHLALRRADWDAGRDACLVRARAAFGFPLYVKPASLGSSVGVSRCEDDAELAEALELAFELDRVCLVEPAAQGGIEVNCAVIGRPGEPARASVCEQPLASGGLLSFEDKYMRSGKAEGSKSAQRLIPAPIGDRLTERVRELARAAFAAFGCAGVTRVDFLVDAQERVWINELNTIPGSFSFYLWEPAGLPFVDLMDKLLDLALADHRDKQRTTTAFDTNLLALRAGGAKGGAEKG